MTQRASNSRKHALDFLSEMVPRALLKRARVLAEEIERDEYVRGYIAKRAYLIVITLFATIAIAVIIAIGLVEFVTSLGIEPAEHRIFVGLLVGAALLSIGITPTFFLILRLERDALRETSRDN
jgi:hypothetical protein